MKKSIFLFMISCAFLMGLFFSTPRNAYAQTPGPIVLDSLFDDWIGQSCISDPQNDQTGPATTDIKSLCFATNPNDPTLYFMAERWTGGNQKVTYNLNLDTNQDGIVDRVVEVKYDPKNTTSEVEVTVFDGNGNKIQKTADDMDWGESRTEGGFKVEWGVPMDILGITTGQTIDMWLDSRAGEGNTISDTTQLITWSPANALGIALLAVILLGGALWFTRLRRRTGTPLPGVAR
ncbi:MAG: hypothetical protein Fur0018_19610 [Anaerolineales bacterium]